jgi:hypothetical protein
MSIYSSAKGLNFTSIDFNNNPEYDENNKLKQEKSITKNIDIIHKYHEENKTYCNLLASNFRDQIHVFII